MHEQKTKSLIISYLNDRTDLDIIDCGLWFYAVWHGDSSAKRIAFRADYDAVCGANGVAGHYCGHDGHTAILAAFAIYVSDIKPQNSIKDHSYKSKKEVRLNLFFDCKQFAEAFSFSSIQNLSAFSRG